jgi:2-polyprenyl-3-methyl-5-hydroxy-6-metoxy-1,4-benzoquinol methylase
VGGMRRGTQPVCGGAADRTEADHRCQGAIASCAPAGSGPNVGAAMGLDPDSFKYWAPVDPSAPNNAHAFALALIGREKRVLELGCSAGHVTQALAGQGCSVVGIEYDEKAAKAAEEWAEEVIVTDLFDPANLAKAVAGREFDVVYAGDVLEHLPDPAGVLTECRKALGPGGTVVVSLPNVAHVDVKLALLAGRFEYRDFGLLDRTHLRFFTRASIGQLFEEAGLQVVEVRRVLRPPFETELEVDHATVPADVLALALEDPEAQTYQFVVRAVPDDGSSELALASRRYQELDAELARERGPRLALELEHERLVARLEALEADHQRRSEHEHALATELDALKRTKTFRATAGLRRIYGALRGAR